VEDIIQSEEDARSLTRLFRFRQVRVCAYASTYGHPVQTLVPPNTQSTMAEENVLPIPNLALPQECFVLQQSSLSHLHDTARVALLRGIKADQMAPYYRLVVAANVLPLDQVLLDKLEKENAAELERLDKVLKEAEETEGESDIADALRAKASYLTKIGEKVRRPATSLLSPLVHRS
jgi:hypothetical protein